MRKGGEPVGTRFDGRNRCAPGRSGQAGLITLEWLLIVGTIAGLAASTTLIVQRVLDDHSEVPPDPVVRFIQADIAAAEIATEAQAAFDANPSADLAEFNTRCNTDLQRRFSDVVTTMKWAPPSNNGTPQDDDDMAATCVATPIPGLGG